MTLTYSLQPLPFTNSFGEIVLGCFIVIPSVYPHYFEHLLCLQAMTQRATDLQ